MIITTTENIPGRQYEILGIVIGNRTISLLSKTELSKAIDKMSEEASFMGADAVVAVKPYTTANGSTSVIGTAVKFI